MAIEHSCSSCTYLERGACPERRHRERHGEAMVTEAVDGAAAEALGALQPQPIGQQLVLDAEHREPGRHPRQAIALLDAQLVRAAHHALPARAGGGHEEHRELIDGERHQRLGHRDAAQRAAPHLQVRDELHRARAPARPRVHADVGSHAPEDLEQSGARRVDAHVLQDQRRIRRQTPRDQEERRGREIRRHLDRGARQGLPALK